MQELVPSQNDSLKDLLWSLPQPFVVLGSAVLVATAISTGWTDADQLTSIILLLPIPTLLLWERLTPRRGDWLLNWRDFLEDSFWVLATYMIWVPLYDEYYDTPISEAFDWLREASAFPVTIQAETTLGLLSMAFLAMLMVEFIYYWLHRIQHRYMFFWRMHATHHHITKMSAARADRTHPLEFMALSIGPAIILAFFQVSGDVISVFITLRLTTVYFNHCNLPLRSGLFGLLFTTAEWHALHHSLERDESDQNFGCALIIWDRVFGTFNGNPDVARVGNGTGEQLSLYMQLTMPFRSVETLKNL